MSISFPATCLALLVIAVMLALIGLWLGDDGEEHHPRKVGFLLWFAAVLGVSSIVSLSHWFLAGGG